MSEVFHQLLKVSSVLEEQIKSLPKITTPGVVQSFNQEGKDFGSEMWYTDSEVWVHKDSQPFGFWTFLWILVNDCEHMLMETDLGCITTTPLTVGSLLCFDSSLYHKTTIEFSETMNQRLAFLAWDMPKDQYSLEQFHKELCEEFKLEI